MLGWLGKLNIDVIEEFSKIMGKSSSLVREQKDRMEIEHLKKVFMRISWRNTLKEKDPQKEGLFFSGSDGVRTRDLGLDRAAC